MAQTNGTRDTDNFCRTLVFPSLLSHTRLFPKFLRFSYPYLLVGVPIQPQSVSGQLVSVDVDKRGWFSVEGEDHLERGTKSLNDKGQLRHEFPYIYLVCAPRFLGYQFNPASIWYFYNQNRILRAVLVEVNNTFGERHLYWCPDQNEDTPGQLHFAWSKDFHVSPFNSRKGSYTLFAADPFAETRPRESVIENRIALLSNHGRAKMVARVRSTGKPIDPATTTNWDATKLVLLWWWIGLATFPRILSQAVNLYFGCKLHVWFRPEVRTSSISQNPTISQRVIERFFRLMLSSIALKLPKGVAIRYISPFADSDQPKSTIWNSPACGRDADPVKEIRVHVTSAMFYSRLVYYPSILAALNGEDLYSCDENRTVHVHGLEELSHYLRVSARTGKCRSSLLGHILQSFRGTLPSQNYPPPATADSAGAFKGFSEMDEFVSSTRGWNDCLTYFPTVTFIFLSQSGSIYSNVVGLLCVTTVLLASWKSRMQI